MKHNSELTPLAQRLRREMTKEERKLWYDFLNTYPYRFRRQVAFGHYILDFYCSSAKLAVELDGSQHYSAVGAPTTLFVLPFLKKEEFGSSAFPIPT